MSQLQLSHAHGDSITVRFGDRELFRYVYCSKVGADESPKPYFHPVRTLSGNSLTNFRPNDHPWHHALCHTISRVGEVNYWGGPSYRQESGYQFRGDQGRQVHRAWTRLALDGDEPVMEEELEWVGPDDSVQLSETRKIMVSVRPDESAWTLRFCSRLTNVTGAELALGNYCSSFGLKGSHYTGLLMRMARDYLFCDFDEQVGIMGEGGLKGVDQVHGVQARWVALAGRHDTTLDRTTTIFVDDSPTGPVHWFVRDKLPAVGFSFQFDQDRNLETDSDLVLDHRLIMAEGALDAPGVAALVG
jgi:hypothetical protein